MRVSAVFCAVFISTAIAEKWRLNQQTSGWKFQTVRKHVDIHHSVKHVSLTGCASFCSNFDSTIIPSLFFKIETGQCMCNSATVETFEDESEPEIVYGIHTKLQKVEENDDLDKRTVVWPYLSDCATGNDKLNVEDGVYAITPPGGQELDAWCDMANGGWTVILRRMDGSENFYRNWNDYVLGFGNKSGEYWIGLEALHHLTINGSQLMVYMAAHKGVVPSSMTAHYSNFKIGDVDSNYQLYISGFNGTCGDSFKLQNGQQFTTFDNDNDDNDHNCAIIFKGAWWYKSCHDSHLTGQYYKRAHITFELTMDQEYIGLRVGLIMNPRSLQ